MMGCCDDSRKQERNEAMTVSYKHCGKWPPDPRCMTKQIAGAVGRVMLASIRGEKVRVSDEVQAQRLAICEKCPSNNFIASQRRCRLCGCYMGGLLGKTAWATESCPNNPPHWGAVES